MDWITARKCTQHALISIRLQNWCHLVLWVKESCITCVAGPTRSQVSLNEYKEEADLQLLEALMMSWEETHGQHTRTHTHKDTLLGCKRISDQFRRTSQLVCSECWASALVHLYQFMHTHTHTHTHMHNLFYTWGHMSNIDEFYQRRCR